MKLQAAQERAGQNDNEKENFAQASSGIRAEWRTATLTDCWRHLLGRGDGEAAAPALAAGGIIYKQASANFGKPFPVLDAYSGRGNP